MEERRGGAMGKSVGVRGGEEGGGGSHCIEIEGEFEKRTWRWEGFDPKIKEDVEEEERVFMEASGSTSSCSGTLGRVSAPDRDYVSKFRYPLCIMETWKKINGTNCWVPVTTCNNGVPRYVVSLDAVWLVADVHVR
ncbi:hypothetical protein BHM03_00024771 [Ensete ventricosum]|nr:hypothetical protein BHM03_00024771 [Ensete ventricosum]